MDLLKYEKTYWDKGVVLIAGIDEAGRGPLAGPVVAASVIIDKNFDITDINDSKKISPLKRIVLFDKIIENAIDVSIGIAHEHEIDNLNILQATFLAMRRALGNMKVAPEQLLIDGPMSDIEIIPVENIISGDSKSASIAAASIIAKVYRDRMMEEYHKIYPEYGFNKHKGYGTKKHIESLIKFKATPIHRKTFKIVKSNLPTLAYYEKNNLFNIAASNFVASEYVKKNFIIFDKYIEIPKVGDIIDYFFINKSDKKIFLKIITNHNNMKMCLGNTAVDSIEKYLIHLEYYLIKKELNKDFTFNVILVEFISNKRPLMKIIQSESVL